MSNTDGSNAVYIATLHKLLAQHFDLEELRTLCFGLGVEYDDLRGEGKSAKARELVKFVLRRRGLAEMLAAAKQERPQVEWPEVPVGFDAETWLDVAEKIDQLSISSSSRPISWREMKLACQEKSQYHLDMLRQKYDPGLYVERESLRQHTDRFLRSDEARYLVLNGQAGMGKTGFLCRLEEGFRGNSNIACLVYDCGALIQRSGEECPTSLIDCLAQGILPDQKNYNLTTLLDRVERTEGQQLVIIVDSINESKNMDVIIRMLADLQSDKSYPWVKVILSCRPHVWPQVSVKMMLPRSAGGYRIPSSYFYRPLDVDEWYVEVTGFGDEKVKEAYQKYQKCYNLQPEKFDDLDPALQARLREPLLLWLVSEICIGDQISMAVAGADISVIPAFTTRLLKKHGVGEGDRSRAACFLESKLPELMVVNQNCQNTVPREKVLKADATMLELFLETGILDENANSQIRFRFERFYDYYFGCYLREVMRQDPKLDCQPVSTH